MNVKQVKVEDLAVSTINPRFTNTVIDEQQAIINLLNQDVDKMLNLLKNIKEDGFLPIPFYLVKEETTNTFVVMDGNRRLTALKIIGNPSLIPNLDKFKVLTSFCNENQFNAPEEVPCIIFDKYTDSLLDTLVKLHVTDESKLIWTPLAQYNMSQKMGGNKYKWMKTLLHYYDIGKIEEITNDNADSFTRLFSAISTRGIKINDDGKLEIENDIDAFNNITKVITSKILNTRKKQVEYEKKVEELLLGSKPQNDTVSQLFVTIQPDSFYEGQSLERDKMKIVLFNERNEKINYEETDLIITYINPLGQKEEQIDTSVVGSWTVQLNYLGEVCKKTINILNKVKPDIKFISASANIQLGETCDLKNFIVSANNSYNENIIKKISVSPNAKCNFTADIINNVFTNKNKKGTYQITYEFTDIDGSPFSKVFVLEVDDFKRVAVTAKKTEEKPMMFDVNVNINIEPVVNDLINEIQSLNFVEHSTVIACSIRSILEITIDFMEKKGYISHKNNLTDQLNELISHLKSFGANQICNIKKSKYYSSFNGLINILDGINVKLINALVNLGAHKSKKAINETTFKETINKDIVQLLNIINEYVN